MGKTGSSQISQRGFTIIEFLTAFAVFSVVLVLLLQVFNQANSGIDVVSRRVNSAAQTRTAFDRVAYDIGSMVILRKIDDIVTKKAGNDTMTFFARVRTDQINSRFARLIYEVQNEKDNGKDMPALSRGNAAVSWSATPSSVPNATPIYLSPGIFRMEMAFLSKDGKLTASAPADPSNLTALVVAVAVLDPKTLQLLQASDITALAGRLPDAQDGKTPAMNWSADLFAGLPDSVRQNVRFYERSFYLP